jgi:hypothetical protein
MTSNFIEAGYLRRCSLMTAISIAVYTRAAFSPQKVTGRTPRAIDAGANSLPATRTALQLPRS